VTRLLCTALVLISALGCGHRADRATDAATAGSSVSDSTRAETARAIPPPPADGTVPDRGSAAAEPHRDLGLDEQQGGHTLSRHVGRSDSELVERLRRERDISAASTYIDRAGAERVVGRAIELNQSRIRQWEQRQGGRPNLVLHYVQRGSAPTGRVLVRSAAGVHPADGALVVLRWDDRRRNWYVLTSYPELAR
jgi:hypothetical protein